MAINAQAPGSGTGLTSSAMNCVTCVLLKLLSAASTRVRLPLGNVWPQLMASMFGPQAAFQPEQLAGMVQNPIKPTLSPELYNYQGTDPKKQAEINSFMQREAAYKQSEEKRRNQVMGGVSPLPAGPAPISMPTPQAARKY